MYLKIDEDKGRRRRKLNITLFITVLTIGAAITALLTEAIKKAYSNEGKEYSANVIALVNAVVVGCGGTAVTYMLLDIEWTVNNIICMVLMGIAVWIGSMTGYDKIIQLVKQVSQGEKYENKQQWNSTD